MRLVSHYCLCVKSHCCLCPIERVYIWGTLYFGPPCPSLSQTMCSAVVIRRNVCTLCLCHTICVFMQMCNLCVCAERVSVFCQFMKSKGKIMKQATNLTFFVTSFFFSKLALLIHVLFMSANMCRRMGSY